MVAIEAHAYSSFEAFKKKAQHAAKRSCFKSLDLSPQVAGVATRNTIRPKIQIDPGAQEVDKLDSHNRRGIDANGKPVLFPEVRHSVLRK